MNMAQLFEKKKHGKELSQAEIEYFVEGYTTGAIPDYQASSLLMAIRLLGMTYDETFYLTKAMVESGDVIDLSTIEGFKIDKHSTGGVGDKVTLIVTPIIAALDIPVAKFSGKGLGITGGTIDKLESIRGVKTELSSQEFIDNVNKHKIAVAGQTGNLVPADKKLYALRDVTGTVDSIPLIAASIMSKKIASGADGIVLDVKCGSGAFMKTEEEAQVLADTMTAIGEKLGRKVVAHISDMDNPLGKMIGNKLEVVEAFALLSGRMDETHEDLFEECIIISSLMYQVAAGVNETEATAAVKRVLEDGSAAAKFEEFIVAQGGDLADIVQKDTANKVAIKAPTEGTVGTINALLIGEASVGLGAGRFTKESELDYDAGIQLIAKKGDHVRADETIAYLYSNRQIDEETIEKVQKAYTIA
ncbi:thymidine phosphorylase [Lysinibacillus sp. NPDC094403]|uniref:thymidine phosphorylase n=1 Tax=Lysinibacillus sp. NPDC094403 TaxID=3390581 RepID=UPI003CFD1181